jgi:hypothetical protein
MLQQVSEEAEDAGEEEIGEEEDLRKLLQEERRQRQELEKVLGRQGEELGKLRLLAQQQQQGAQQPEPDPYQELDAVWYQAQLQELTESIKEQLMLRLTDEEDAEAMAKERAEKIAIARYQVRLKEREIEQKKEQDRLQRERMERNISAAPDDYERIVAPFINSEGITGVTPREVAEVLKRENVVLTDLEDMARDNPDFLKKQLAITAKSLAYDKMVRGGVPTVTSSLTAGPGVAGARSQAPLSRRPASQAEANARKVGQMLGFSGDDLEQYVRNVVSVMR